MLLSTLMLSIYTVLSVSTAPQDPGSACGEISDCCKAIIIKSRDLTKERGTPPRGRLCQGTAGLKERGKSVSKEQWFFYISFKDFITECC